VQWLIQDSSAVQLSPAGVAAWTPRVAVDSNGGAVAIWVQYDGGLRARVWGSRWDGSGWGIPQQISTNGAADASVPELGSDAVGNAIAVWHQGNGSANHFDVCASQLSAGGNWSSPFFLSDGSNSAYNPRVSMNGMGDAWVVWSQDQGDGSLSNVPRDTWARRYHASSWGIPTQVNSISGATNHVKGQIAIGMDSNGNSVALWIQSGTPGSGTRLLWAARHPAGGAWGAAEIVSTTALGDAFDPEIALDAAGHAVAVWQQQDGASASIAFSECDWGAVWSTPQLVSSGADAFDPQVAIDQGEVASILWYQTEASGVTVQSCTIHAGVPSSPTPRDTFSVDPYLYFPIPRVAANGAGTVSIVWGLGEM